MSSICENYGYEQSNGLDRILLRCHRPIHFDPPSLSQRMEDRGDRMFKILSIDGGGIRGIIPLKILTELEKIIGPASETFDLISGTSTGGIIGLGLAASCKELSAEEILHMYQNRSEEIFVPNPQRWIYRNITKPIAWLPIKLFFSKEVLQGFSDYPMYTNDGVRKIAHEILGENLMKDARTNLLIPAVDINEKCCHFFTNRDIDDAFLSAKDVACATSAAPIYFPAKKVRQSTYLDGGLSCNNPAEKCYDYSSHEGIPDKSQYILSLGTGFADIEGIPGKDHNIAYWAKNIYPIMDRTLNNTVNKNLQRRLGDRYWRINPEMDREIGLDDHEQNTLKELNDIGDAIVEERQDVIRNIARILRPDIDGCLFSVNSNED